MTCRVLVGLGNPGPTYQTTRHNAGHLVLNQLVSQAGGVWEKQKRVGAEVVKVRHGNAEFLCVKPTSFMNVSGSVVRSALGYYRCAVSELVLLHDDVDLPLGIVRKKVGGGHGGHNGVRDVIAALGGPDFTRIKIGVGRPPAQSQVAMEQWVLMPMMREELDEISNTAYNTLLSRLESL